MSPSCAVLCPVLILLSASLPVLPPRSRMTWSPAFGHCLAHRPRLFFSKIFTPYPTHRVDRCGAWCVATPCEAAGPMVRTPATHCRMRFFRSERWLGSGSSLLWCCFSARWTVTLCGAHQPLARHALLTFCRTRPYRGPEIPFSTSIPATWTPSGPHASEPPAGGYHPGASTIWGSHDGRPPEPKCPASVESLYLLPATSRVLMSAS